MEFTQCEKISIIIPIYNAECYLDACIHSIVNQTYSNFELLLIDDGSSDNSSALCERWALRDSRVKVYHKKNGGVSSARNKGLAEMTGSYIMFIDADDYIEPDLCEQLVIAMADDCDWVVSGAKVINSITYYRSPVTKKICRNTIDETFNLLYTNYLLNSVWGKLYRRSCLGNLQFDVALFMGEDIVFNLHYMENCKQATSILSYCGYCYNVDNNASASNTFKTELFQQKSYIHGRLLSFAETLNLSNDCQKRINNVLFEDAISYLQGLYFSLLSRECKRKYAFECMSDNLLVESVNKLHIEGFNNRLMYSLIKKKRERILYIVFVCKYWIKKILKRGSKGKR